MYIYRMILIVALVVITLKTSSIGWIPKYYSKSKHLFALIIGKGYISNAHTNNSIHMNTIVGMIAFVDTVLPMRISMNTSIGEKN